MTLISRIRRAGRIFLQRQTKTRRIHPIPNITPAEVAEIKLFFPRDKFFIFGHARSGTTLLMRLVRLHPEVHCNYQAHFFTRSPLLRSLVDTPEAEEWLSRKSNRWNHGRDLSPVVLRAAAEFIMEREARKERKGIVGDKSPTSAIHGQSVRDLHAIFPEAKLVYIVRDGRDVLISERFRNFVEESRFLNRQDRQILEDLRRTPSSFAEAGRSIFTPSMIRRVARGWSENITEVDAEGKRLFSKHYFALRYEDLLANPYGEMTRLWNFLGVRRVARSLNSRIVSELHSNPDEEWQSRRNHELSSFVSKGKTGNWRSVFTDPDKRIFKESAGETLMTWNYEETPDW